MLAYPSWFTLHTISVKGAYAVTKIQGLINM